MPDDQNQTQTFPTSSTENQTPNPLLDELAKSIRHNEINGNNDLLARQMKAAGIFQPWDMKYKNKFYRFRRIDPHYQVEGGFEYLFFTKPDLAIIDSAGDLMEYHYQDTDFYGAVTDNIKGGSKNIPYFRFLKDNNYMSVLSDLCASYTSQNYHGTGHCPFVRMLTNRKVSNMDVPDIVTNEIETAQNMYGTRIFYPTSSMKSDEDVEFSVEFEDTQYLEIYHFFKAFDVYRQAKWLGLVKPKKDYVENKILHDHMSIYKFIVDTDGETLLYWAKATGVYPRSISRSAFSEFQDKGGLKINVTFKLSGWFEDMEPNILTDFNQLVMKYAGSSSVAGLASRYKPMWDEEIQAISGESVDYFYIERVEDIQDGTNFDNYTRYLFKAGRFANHGF